MKDTINVAVSKATHQRLKDRASWNQPLDEVIKELLDEHEGVKRKRLNGGICSS